MLVRDSEALVQFRVDHRIPDDVVIERPGPNDDADWVKERVIGCPLGLGSFTKPGFDFPLGEGLEFTAEDLFHVYCVVKPRKNPETQMLEGNHYLRLRKPNQPQTRLVTDSPDKDQYLNDFIWVSGQWEFPADEPYPFSVPRHRGYVPVGFNRRFWRRSDRCSAAISAVNNYGRPAESPIYSVTSPYTGTSAELRRLLEEAEGESSGSSESSSSSWDIDLGDEALNEEAEVKDGEEVDQVPVAVPLVPAPLVLVPEPINLPSSDSDVAIVEPREIIEHSSTPAPAEDQSIAPSLMGGKRKGKQPAEGTSQPKRGKGAGSAAGTPELWAPQFAAVELGKQVTSADTSKDHETCVALGNAVILPQDVADHAAETTTEFGGKFIMLGAQANSLEKELKQTKSELTDARSAAEIAILQRNHAQEEASDLKRSLAVKCTRSCSTALSSGLETYPLDHPAWSSPAPPVQLPAFPERYSPINLPDFNEEEYATLPADEGNINIAVVEAHAGVAETADRDRVGEAEGDRALEAEVRYSARAGDSIELASRSPLAFAEYRSLVGLMPYLEATIHKA
ncbi:hypothetical protein Acr_10g0005490 [Actinidia rufa]|uniref:Uncharacterized protein n=1 Tax=Actinidia rufa TaxID=165716 RepID=A0A7J0F8X9_9ERIC|nr:hypothetical protein Acr_10g0005490 [Actinidia rufa]